MTAHCPATGKVAHETQHAARTALRQVRERRRSPRARKHGRGPEATVYRCPDCAAWHLAGPAPRWRR